MVPRMANAPELLSLALACWVGLCLYISLLDRTPRSYMFMLAGYTAGLIGFPAVSDPSAVFDTALARVEETSIGILAATVVHSLVFPQGGGLALLGRLDRALGDAQRWFGAVLNPAPSSKTRAAKAVHMHLALAGEISEMRVMSTHLPFDTSHLRWTAGMVHALHERLTVTVNVQHKAAPALAHSGARHGEHNKDGTVDARRANVGCVGRAGRPGRLRQRRP